jgi:superfamily II DNA or RNA helicase
MSQTENATRWEPSAILRQGQQELYNVVSNQQKSKYSIQLPTGYGKSWCACIAYAVMRGQHRVNRMLIIVPTDQQRSQYAEGLAGDLKALGIPYSGIERCDNQGTWVIKQAHRNKSEIFVAGIGSISADIGYYTDLMSKGSWVVVADEFHHYAEDNTWGKAIESLSYEVILGMSATPFRKDKKNTIFGAQSFDVSVSIEDAYKEGAIKRVEANIGDYVVSWSTLEDPSPRNGLMSEYETEAEKEELTISEYERKKGVRYYDKYISSIFLQLMNKYYDYEAQWPRQNQILVFAISCRHAEIVAKIINECAGGTGFADWIGVGEGDSKFGSVESSRSDKQNAEILSRFQSNQLPCLVQVNKAGEGFNNKRCSIGLFLDLVGDCPNKRQHIGRFMRVNPESPGQSSVIFISEDAPCRGLLEGLTDDFDAADGLTPEEAKAKRQQGSRQLVIPDVFIIDANFSSDRIAYPFGDSAIETIKALRQTNPDVDAMYRGMTEADQIHLLHKALKIAEAEKHPPLTSEQRRDQAREKVKASVAKLVNHVCQKKYGKSVPGSVKGDLFRVINSRWKRDNMATADMTEEDLLRKNKWLQDLADRINQEEYPTWLIP